MGMRGIVKYRVNWLGYFKLKLLGLLRFITPSGQWRIQGDADASPPVSFENIFGGVILLLENAKM
jgi:hypothetical protein